MYLPLRKTWAAAGPVRSRRASRKAMLDGKWEVCGFAFRTEALFSRMYESAGELQGDANQEQHLYHELPWVPRGAVWSTPFIATRHFGRQIQEKLVQGLLVAVHKLELDGLLALCDSELQGLGERRDW
jgi:hypothetical protein